MKTNKSNPVCITLLIIFAAASNVSADEIITDRPDQTESSVSVSPGSIQIETGITISSDETTGDKLRNTMVPETLARIGLMNRVELRLGWDGYGSSSINSGSFSLEGSGDPSIGGKFELGSMSERATQIAAMFTLTLPVGSSSFGNDFVVPSGRISISHTLSESTSLGYNLGAIGVITDDDANGSKETRIDPFYTVAFGSALGGAFGGFIELFGEISADGSSSARHSLDGGITYLLNETLQLDLAGGFGLSAKSEDRFVTLGVSKLFSSE